MSKNYNNVNEHISSIILDLNKNIFRWLSWKFVQEKVEDLPLKLAEKMFAVNLLEKSVSTNAAQEPF